MLYGTQLGNWKLRKKEIRALHPSPTYVGLLCHIPTLHIPICSLCNSSLTQCRTAGLVSIREGQVDKTMTQRFHALCRLLLPFLPSPLEDLGKDVYAEYKRFKDVCWILRDGARQEINGDLAAGSSTAALCVEQHFLGQVVEGVRLPRTGGLGIMKPRHSQRAGYSQGLMYLGAGDRGMLCCRTDLGVVTCVQEQGWEGKRGRASRGRGDRR